MKNNKGFTLVELLVVIVIMGIVMGMSWPIITKIQENNEISKYDKYGEALIEAAKLYVDSYEEDLFYYEDDLSPGQKDLGQCAYITYNDLYEHLLIKDFNVNGMTCNSESTYVQVVRRKGKYKYTYYLGCGNKKSDGSQLKNGTGEIFYTAPKESTENYMNTATCSKLHSDGDAPVAKNVYFYTNPYYYNRRYNDGTYVYVPYGYIGFYAVDNDTDPLDIKYCLSKSATECSNYYSVYNSNGFIEDYVDNIADSFDGSTVTYYIHLRDLNGNESTTPVSATLYKSCSYTYKDYNYSGACSAECGGGVKPVKYYLRDYYHYEEKCSDLIEADEPCNGYSCCIYVYRECTNFKPLINDKLATFDKAICDGACGSPVESRLMIAKCTSYSTYDPELLCEKDKTVTTLTSCPDNGTACLDIRAPWISISNADYFCDYKSVGHSQRCIARRYEGYQRVKFNKYLYVRGEIYNTMSYKVIVQFTDNTTGEVYCQGEWADCSEYRYIGDERKNVTVLYYVRFEDGSKSPYTYVNVVAPDEIADVTFFYD